ncbi:MAG: histidine kinase [Desulfobacteraceae bacterium IS3]|nr:MAG: histidine kinase [Desulfobacteraceae bacterium IS3]
MENKILLVDDEEDIRDVLGMYLADIGYEVLTAENGEEALRVFRKENPPIILSDIKMPGMDGIRLLETIKRENPDTEVIMITGHGDMELAIKSLKYEATDFVTKPINDDVLEIALKRANEKITMRRQLREYTENLENLVKEKSARLVEAERLATIGQAVEGLSSVIWDIAGDLDGGIRYFNEMPCFVSVHNRHLKIVATNELYKQRLGNKVGANSWDIYVQDPECKNERSENFASAKITTCPVRETFKTGTGHRQKATIRYSDGNEVPVIVHTAPIRSKDGELEWVLEISADITEIKRLQEELRTAEQKFQQLFDEAPCYISVQNRNFRITAANRRFKEDFGEDIGCCCFEIYKHRTEPCPDCPVAKTFDDGESHASEMVVTSKGGEQYNVLIWTAPLQNAAGDITEVMEMSTNITQIRRLQDHLSSLGLLIGSISHGIKGLLTGLDGGMYLVSSGFAKENHEQIKEGWETVKLMVERIRKMVLNILYYAKERDLQWETVDVISFARDLAFTAEPKIQGNNIEFISDFDKSAGVFEIDPGVVHSALINILENAVEACAEDRSKQSHRIVFSVTQDKNYIIFDVRDDGVGMDRETRENMFTLFFSSKGNKGTGLGLFISDKIIRQHGGSIDVDSEPGKGSHFCIRMPKILPESVKAAYEGARKEDSSLRSE